MFKLTSQFSPIEEQKKATAALAEGISRGLKNQVLLGVTGSGKTFTMANLIQNLQKPALIISHNKTLAGQLYQEMRDFFPENAVSYFVSYYDFYQPEAYIPQSDTYIEKEAQINEIIDKLRLATTSNILTRNDVIVVASVSCIYNIGSPVEYGRFILELKKGAQKTHQEVMVRLVELQYDRSEFDFKRGTFRVRGSYIDIYPAYEDRGIRVTIDNDSIQDLYWFDPLTGQKNEENSDAIVLYPAKHYLTDPRVFESVEETIRKDLTIEYKALKDSSKDVEAYRLMKKVNYDLEMIKEMGYVNGIENYSRYFDGRAIGDPPYTLLDYFNHKFGKDWLVFIDESHMTVPQIRGMYNGDNSRKKTLIDYGFRLQSALDNRPLKFDEFYNTARKIIYVSATPNEWEIQKSDNQVIEQLVRPTGIIDPAIDIRDSKDEIPDLLEEIKKRVERKERVLVTTLTKRISEDLTEYLKQNGVKAEYLHSDIQTLERSEILKKLRLKNFDVLVGINLLREGLDLPEVTLVAILDAENEGFLRSKTALIQLMGRAARNIEGRVIIYTSKMTNSIQGALSEVNRRRQYQIDYNKKFNIEPSNINKEIKDQIIGYTSPEEQEQQNTVEFLESIDEAALTPLDKKKLLNKLSKEMKKQAKELNFELAIAIREKMNKLS